MIPSEEWEYLKSNREETQMTKTLKSISATMATTALCGAMALGATTTLAIADAHDEVMVGFTPKFLSDDFQTLMLDLSLKAFDGAGFTLVGAPDPNGDIAAQVTALQNLRTD